MSKFQFARASAALGALALLSMPSVSAQAALLGPDAGVCASGNGPAVLVRVTGLKSRVGQLRVRTFPGNNSKAWFNKKMQLKRTEVVLPASGPVEVCMPVPAAGGYVVDIRHDANNNRDTDKADGAGVSGNPNVSFFSFLMGKKPPAAQVVVNVGKGVATTNIVVKYLQGGSFKPVGG